jgi:hypothetical protein
MGTQIGTGHVPLTDWKAFFDGVQNSEYRADRLGLCGDAFARVGSGRHSVRVSLGFVRTSAHASFVSVYNPGPGALFSVVDWDFTAVPLGLDYEVSFRGPGSVTTPFVGFGPSVYYSRVTSADRTLYPPEFVTLFGRQNGKRQGWGYGFASYIGQRVPVTHSLLFSTLLRAQWADGMGFTDQKGDVPVHFSGVDVCMGVEWDF